MHEGFCGGRRGPSGSRVVSCAYPACDPGCGSVTFRTKHARVRVAIPGADIGSRIALILTMHTNILELTLFGVTVIVTPWKLIGYAGALMFASRWIVQLCASRRLGRSVIPRAFWYMSVTGSLLVLSYFVWGKNDSVGIINNLFPLFTACYNLSIEVRPRAAADS